MSSPRRRSALSSLLSTIMTPSGAHGDSVRHLLRTVRTHLGMDVAFVSEFVAGRRVFRFVDSAKPGGPIHVGDSDPEEEGYCRHVVEGRLPELIPDTRDVPAAVAIPATAATPVGAHLCVPIRLQNGRVYGTFCCFSFEPDQSLNERDLQMVRAFADLAATHIEHQEEQDRKRQHDVDHIESVIEQHQREVLGHLTGSIAHDFNNLLAVILGSSEIVFDEIEDPELKEQAKLVMEAAEKGAILTERLLAFGRRQALRPEPVDLDEMIASLSSRLSSTLGDRIRLKVQSTGNALALADKGLLESAILNLVLNARDAMPDGGTLTISQSVVDCPDDPNTGLTASRYMRVTVCDTGAGMPTEVQERVFDPFFTTKEVSNASGMGLSMVHGFVKQSGGHITIDSRIGLGTTVEIYLPLAQAIDVVQDRPAAVGTQMLGRDERILVVEDEPQVRRFVRAKLSDLGYQVIEAEGGNSALEILRSEAQVDLLLTDIILPHGIGGLELANHARQERPDIKILLTTGYAAESDGTLANIRDPILKKPYKKQQLAELVRRTLDGVV